MPRSLEEIVKAELGTLVYQCCVREYQLASALEELAKARALLPKGEAPAPLPDA